MLLKQISDDTLFKCGFFKKKKRGGGLVVKEAGLSTN